MSSIFASGTLGTGQVIKISRRSIPHSMAYKDYVTVYQQFLLWIQTVRLTDESHPAFTAKSGFLSDQQKLQRYLKVSQGRLVGAQKRLLLALDRIRRMVTQPDFSASPEAGVVSPSSCDSATTPPDQLPSTVAPKSILIATSSNPGPQIVRAAEAFELHKRSNSDSVSAASVEEEAGIATLLMLRRRKEGNKPPIPAPLKGLTRSLEPPGQMRCIASNHQVVSSQPLSGLPSSHPYYRSHFVLATPTATTACSSPLHKMMMVSPGVVKQEPRSPRALLPAALQELKLVGAECGRDTAMQQSFSVPASARATLSVQINQSPRIYMPPPPYNPTARRVQHARSVSDQNPRSAVSPISQLKFIPPPKQTASPRGQGFIPQNRPLEGRIVSASQPSDHVMRTPTRESFIRTPPVEPSTGVPRKAPIQYQPSGNVETRRVTPQRKSSPIDSTHSRTPSGPESGDSNISAPRRHVIHPPNSSHGNGGRILLPPPPLVMRSGLKRHFSDMTDYADGDQGSSESKKARSLPDSRRDESTALPSGIASLPPTNGMVLQSQLASQKPRPKPMETSNGPSNGSSSTSGSKILDAMLGELRVKRSIAGRQGANEIAAIALEEVAEKLRAIANKLRVSG